MNKMKYKAFALFALLIFLVTPISILSQEPPVDNTLTSPPTTQAPTPEQQFNSQPTPDNFMSLPNPTAEDLANVKPAPSPENFAKLSGPEQGKYLDGNYNSKFAADYFSARGNDLSSAPTAANKFLQEKFGNAGIDFIVSSGMKFADNPPKIAVGGKELTLQTGSESGKIPPGATAVRYDSSNNEFVFDPRGLQATGNKISLDSNGAMTFAEGGKITDPQTGATIDVSPGSKVQIQNGQDGNVRIIVNGEMKGEWKDTTGNLNKFINFEGTLIIQPDVISSQNSQVNVDQSEIKGKFVASLDNGKIRQVSLLNDASSFSKDTASVVGVSSINLYSNGKIQDVELMSTTASLSYNDLYAKGNSKTSFSESGTVSKYQGLSEESILSYGSKLDDKTSNREHLFKGISDVNFNDKGALSDANLGRDAWYKNLKTDIKVSHEQEGAQIFFGDYSKEQADSIASKNPGKAISFIGLSEASSSHIAGYGKINIETGGFIYKGKQDSATFDRQVLGKEEKISIDGKENGEIAEFSKKFNVASLKQKDGLMTGEQALVKSSIVRNNDKVTAIVDDESVRKAVELTGVTKEHAFDYTRFLLSDYNTMINIGSGKAFLGISSDFGMIYESESGKMQYLSRSQVQMNLGKDSSTVKGIVTKSATDKLPIYSQNTAISKIFSLQSQENLKEQDGRTNYFEATSKSFEDTKKFIGEVYSNDLQKNVVTTSFMVSNIAYLKPDYMNNGDKAGFDSSAKEYQDYLNAQMNEIESGMKSNEFMKGLTPSQLQMQLAKDVSANKAISPDEIKTAYMQQFENRLMYEDVVGASSSKRDLSGIASRVDSFKGLITLDETQITPEGDRFKVDRELTSFSEQKLVHSEQLMLEYVKTGDKASALATLDQVEQGLASYKAKIGVDNNVLALDDATQAKYGFINSIESRIRSDRMIVNDEEFASIYKDLMARDAKFDQLVTSRMTYGEKVESSQSALEAVFTAVTSGGLGKSGVKAISEADSLSGVPLVGDIVQAAKGYREVVDYTKELQLTNGEFLKGTMGIKTIHDLGVDGDTAQKILNGELPDEQVQNIVARNIIQNGYAEKADPNAQTSVEFKDMEIGPDGQMTGRRIVNVAGQTYAIDGNTFNEAYGFLKDVRPAAKMTYDSADYGREMKILLGNEKVRSDLGTYAANEDFSTDNRLFATKLAAVEPGKAEKLLNFVDEQASPLTIGMSAGFGAGFGNVFIKSAGLVGAVVGPVESLGMSTAVYGGMQVAGINPEDHPYLSAGLNLAVPFAPATIGRLSKAVIPMSEDIAKNIIEQSPSLAGRTEDIAKALSGVDTSDAAAVKNALKNIEGLDQTKIDGLLETTKLKSYVQSFNAEDLATIGITKSPAGELLDSSGKIISNLDEFEQVARSGEVISKANTAFEEAKGVATTAAKPLHTYSTDIGSYTKGQVNPQELKLLVAETGEKIGTGGYGTVYRVKDLTTHVGDVTYDIEGAVVKVPHKLPEGAIDFMSRQEDYVAKTADIPGVIPSIDKVDVRVTNVDPKTGVSTSEVVKGRLIPEVEGERGTSLYTRFQNGEKVALEEGAYDQMVQTQKDLASRNLIDIDQTLGNVMFRDKGVNADGVRVYGDPVWTDSGAFESTEFTDAMKRVREEIDSSPYTFSLYDSSHPLSPELTQSLDIIGLTPAQVKGMNLNSLSRDLDGALEQIRVQRENAFMPATKETFHDYTIRKVGEIPTARDYGEIPMAKAANQ